MNLRATASRLAPGPLVLSGLIALAALSRLLPHPPNFSPLAAIALFGGAYFASRRMALLVPVLAMVLSDVVLGAARGGTYFDYMTSAGYLPSLVAVYVCIVLTTLVGFGLRSKVSGARVLGYSLAGSVLFYLVSNAAVWLTATMVPGYPACSTGLIPCYVAAVPFFKWTLAGTLLYSAVLFGGFALLRRRLPTLRPQTI